MRLRVQVRSFDAMCHMIAANLGIGVVPLAACKAQVNALDLKVVRLKDAWAVRRLLMATKTGETLSPAAQLLVAQLLASST
jgi:DNA-binding transcriptional LysR family regulator